MLNMTVEELHSLDYSEYIGWQQYFDRRPFGWREDLRAYNIMTAMAGSKVKPEDIFPSIRKLKENEADSESGGDTKMLKSLEASPFGNLLQQQGIGVKDGD